MMFYEIAHPLFRQAGETELKGAEKVLEPIQLKDYWFDWKLQSQDDGLWERN